MLPCSHVVPHREVNEFRHFKILGVHVYIIKVFGIQLGIWSNPNFMLNSHLFCYFNLLVLPTTQKILFDRGVSQTVDRIGCEGGAQKMRDLGQSIQTLNSAWLVAWVVHCMHITLWEDTLYLIFGLSHWLDSGVRIFLDFISEIVLFL